MKNDIRNQPENEQNDILLELLYFVIIYDV